jgi:hypothetical protein
MNSSPPRRSIGNRSKLSGIAVVVLVGIYSLAVPFINDRFGLDLPAIRADSDGQVRVVEADNGNGPSAPETPSDRTKPATRGGQQSPTSKTPVTSEDASNDAGLYGILREVSREKYVSPAGLVYARGSAEGHRLEHLKRHTKDDPGRPGSHGVFDGGMEGALKTIDRAYERAKKGERTTTKKDQGRTIYTVDLGSRIGFVGGRDGNRKRKPMARRVRIVLDGDRVITAYPM